jgi:hypothetical protein
MFCLVAAAILSGVAVAVTAAVVAGVAVALGASALGAMMGVGAGCCVRCQLSHNDKIAIENVRNKNNLNSF